MSQFAAVAKAVAGTRRRRAVAFAGSVATILALAVEPSLTQGSLLVVVVYGGSLVVVGLRRNGPGEAARVPYAAAVPWLRLFFLLCLWEIFNWFELPYGTWRTLSDLTDPALSTWLGRALGATVWVWCGLWLLAADSERDEAAELELEGGDYRGPLISGADAGGGS